MAMNFKMNAKVWVLLAAGVVGIFLVGLLYNCSTKNEPVWASGDAAVVWQKADLPLTVCPIEPFDYSQELASAVSVFNGEVGFKLFEYKDDLTVDCEIVALTGSIENGTEAKNNDFSSSFVKRGDQQVVQVVLNVPGESAQVTLALRHELGRAAGLAEDGAPTSIMSKDVIKGSGLLEDGTAKQPVLTPRDSDALRSRYNK